MAKIEATTKDVQYIWSCADTFTLNHTSLDTSKSSCTCTVLTWPLRTNIHQSVLSKKVGAFLVYKNKVLLVQSCGRFWGFPQGSCLPHESIPEAVCRVTKEETSLTISLTENDRICKIFNTTFFIHYLDKKPNILIDTIKNDQKYCSGIALLELQCCFKKLHGLKLNASTSLFLKAII